MTTRSLGLLYVFRSRLIVAATLLLAFAATPTSGSQPKNGTRAGGEILANRWNRLRSFVCTTCCGHDSNFCLASQRQCRQSSLPRSERQCVFAQNHVLVGNGTELHQCRNHQGSRRFESARFQCRDRLAVRGPHERQLWRQVQEQGRATFLYRCTVCFIVRPGVVFDGLDHVRSHQAPNDRGVFIVHELGQYRHRSGFGQRWDDECLQLWKNGGNPLCRFSEHRLACDG